jgi:hypothetical protein
MPETCLTRRSFFYADYFVWIVDIVVMHNYYLIQREHNDLGIQR